MLGFCNGSSGDKATFTNPYGASMTVELSDYYRPAISSLRNPGSPENAFNDATEPDWGIDQAALLCNCVGNGVFAVSLLNEFGKTGLENVRVIIDHALAERFDDTALAAHSLKGSAAIIGAKKLSSIAANVERSSSEVDRDRLSSHLAQLELEMCDCLQQIPAIEVSIGTNVADFPSLRSSYTRRSQQ